ncbi:hypothetical protein [Nocardioides sp.]|uniref:hypothetical protein n=1 Tax=Nocardioides sp. TaxID=35761 RepID=UPI002EDA78F4
MPYSLVGAHALGFDLARLVSGRQAAAVLRTALTADSTDLDQWAAQHPGAVARSDWLRATTRADARAETVRSVLPLAGAAVEEAVTTGASTLLRRLETSLLGDTRTLDHFVRHDLLDWTWIHSGPMSVQDPTASAAADVLADAAVSGYLGARLDPGVRRGMVTPYLRADLPTRDETASTGMARVDRVLDRLSSADESVRAEWRRVVDEQRLRTAEWAPAMHQASWACSMSGRLRLACDVQLAGVIAFQLAGLTPRDAAYGVWNAVSGVLQAVVMIDLLPSKAAAVLVRPWHLVYGEGPISG